MQELGQLLAGEVVVGSEGGLGQTAGVLVLIRPLERLDVQVAFTSVKGSPSRSFV